MNWNTVLILISACVSCSLGRPSAGYRGYVRYGDSHTSYGYGSKHQTLGGDRHINLGYSIQKQPHSYGNSYNHHYGNYGNKPHSHPQPLPAPSPLPTPSPLPAPFPAPSPIEDIDLPPQGPLTIVRPSLRIDPSQLAAPVHPLTPSHRSPKSYNYAHHFGHKTHYGTYGYKPAYPAPNPVPNPVHPVHPIPLPFPAPTPIQPVHPSPAPFPAPTPIKDIDLPQGPLTIVRPSIKFSKLTPLDLPIIPSSLKSSQLFIPVTTNQIEPFMDRNNHQEESININNDQFEMNSFVTPEQSNSVDSFSDDLLKDFQDLPQPFIDIQNDQFGEKTPFLPEASLDIQNNLFGEKIPFLSDPSLDIQQISEPSMDFQNDDFGVKIPFHPEPSLDFQNDDFGDNTPFLPDPVPAVPVQTQHIVFPDEDSEQLLDFLSQNQDNTVGFMEHVPVFPLQSAEDFSIITGGSLQAVAAVPGLPVLNL